MPLFVVEREFAEKLQLDDDTIADVQRVNAELDVEWLYSFLSADERKTFCIYEAPSADAIREAARRLNIPADAIVEVSEIRPEHFGKKASAAS